MTKEISKEVIAKVYGLYYECQCVYTNIMGNFYSDVNYDVLRRLYTQPSFSPKLILSDLSDISDEDAVEVCRLLDFNSGDKAQMAYLGRGVILFHFCNTIPYDDSLFDTSLSRKFISTVSQPGMVNVIDFLRSRGYMLPAHGITDLFEAGIAVRKNKEV